MRISPCTIINNKTRAIATLHDASTYSQVSYVKYPYTLALMHAES